MFEKVEYRNFVMNFMMVEPNVGKFTAYHFDGRYISAKEAVEKWDCILSEIEKKYSNDNISNELKEYKILFKTGQEAHPNSYIVMENSMPVIYSQSDFINKYQIIYDMRDRISPFMTNDY
jgi:hypothetical protein